MEGAKAMNVNTTSTDGFEAEEGYVGLVFL